MADMTNATDEELEIRKNAVKGRTGFAGKVADFFDPTTRKQANAAQQEMDRRKSTKKETTGDSPVKEITFKKGGSVGRRGDGIVQRGRTKGTVR